MVLVNFATKEIVAKLVYYGPALCGKTTNLQYIFTRLNPKKRGKMISLATESDRTLFFDFLPLEFGTVQGFKIRFQLYTVPGQVFYGATRKLVLKGADAIIFVADSQADVMDRNVESIEDMKANLVENGLDPDTIPLIMQYNKRDLQNLSPIEELEEKVNYRGVPSFEASAVEGFGVMEAFKESTKLLLQELKRKHSFINIDSVRDLPDEVFEQKAEEPEELLDAEIEYELELGSSVEGAGEDVVAGELLDQIETISLTDSFQAEAFFDDYRKGVPTEEAKQKAEKLNVSPPEADISISPARNEELFAAAWEMQDEAGVRTGRRGGGGPEMVPVDISPVDLSPIELSDAGSEFDITHESIMMGDVPPPSSGTFSKPQFKKPQDETFLGMDIPSSGTMGTDGVAFDEQEAEDEIPPPADSTYQEFWMEPEAADAKDSQAAAPSPAPAAEPGTFDELYRDLEPVPGVGEDRPEPSRPAARPVQATEAPQTARPKPQPSTRTDAAPPEPAREQRPEPPSLRPADTHPVDTPGMNAGLEAIMQAVEKLDRKVAELGREFGGLKASLARHGHAGDAPHLEPAQAPSNVDKRIDELGASLKEMADGQDRLLLSILEAVRDAKRHNADSHEKLEDAVKYLIDKVRGDDRTPGRKKWF